MAAKRLQKERKERSRQDTRFGNNQQIINKKCIHDRCKHERQRGDQRDIEEEKMMLKLHSYRISSAFPTTMDMRILFQINFIRNN